MGVRYLVRRLERYEAPRGGDRLFESDLPGLVLQHGIAHVNATLDWLDQTTAALEGPTSRRPRPAQGAVVA